MRCPSLILAFVGIAMVVFAPHEVEAEGVATATERRFSFNYGAELVELTPGAKARVWWPIAKSNPHQEIQSREFNVPAKIQVGRDEKYANEIGFFEIVVPEDGKVAFGVTYDVVRKEAAAYGAGEPLSDGEKELFLAPNVRVPIDGRPVELIGSRDLPDEKVAAGQVLFDVVEQHMKYDKSKPGYGRGDSVWACDSRTGNCTDFHSLFISLARSQSIAAKFEIGFPLPPRSPDKEAGLIGGYHCWAWFHSDQNGWFPVDISEADKHPELKEYYFGKLTADRITMSVGRDIVLVPKSDGEPLNYFVYPHVEVEGVVMEKEKMKGRFAFVEKGVGGR